MTTSRLHEFFKELLGLFVSILVEVLEIDRINVGEAMWKTEDMGRGLQADLSYYFDPEKIRRAQEALKRKSMEREGYPTASDLAIEIDASRPKLDRSSIYAGLRAEELWRFDGTRVVIEQLQPDGTYAEVPTSRFLLVSGEDVGRWLLDDDATVESVWRRRLRQWAEGLRPRA